MNAKKRMSKYLRFKGISHYEFSKSTGLANGYLNSGDNITSANLDTITNKYTDLNLLWLVKGIEPMLLHETIEADNHSNGIAYPEYTDEELEKLSKEELIQITKALRQIISLQEEIVKAKDKTIALLQRM